MKALTINVTCQQRGDQFIGILRVSENEVFFYAQATKLSRPTKTEALQDALDLKEIWMALESQQ